MFTRIFLAAMRAKSAPARNASASLHQVGTCHQNVPCCLPREEAVRTAALPVLLHCINCEQEVATQGVLQALHAREAATPGTQRKADLQIEARHAKSIPLASEAKSDKHAMGQENGSNSEVIGEVKRSQNNQSLEITLEMT